MLTVINNTRQTVDIRLNTSEIQRIKPGNKVEIYHTIVRYRLYGGLWQDFTAKVYKGVSVINFKF